MTGFDMTAEELDAWIAQAQGTAPDAGVYEVPEGGDPFAQMFKDENELDTFLRVNRERTIMGEAGRAAEAVGKGLMSGINMMNMNFASQGQWLANRMGWDWAADKAEFAKDYWKKEMGKWQADPELRGNIIDDPGMMKDASWWAYNTAQMIPSLAVSLLGAKGGGTAFRMLGKTYKLTPMAIERLAQIGQAITGGVVGGGLEAAGTYEQVLSETGDEQLAARSAEVQFSFVAALNALGIEKILAKAGPTFKAKIIKTLGAGFWEGWTEGAEEPAEVLSKVIGAFASGRPLPEQETVIKELKDSLKQAMTVAPVAALSGGGSASFNEVTEYLANRGTIKAQKELRKNLKNDFDMTDEEVDEFIKNAQEAADAQQAATWIELEPVKRDSPRSAENIAADIVESPIDLESYLVTEGLINKPMPAEIGLAEKLVSGQRLDLIRDLTDMGLARFTMMRNPETIGATLLKHMMAQGMPRERAEALAHPILANYIEAYEEVLHDQGEETQMRLDNIPKLNGGLERLHEIRAMLNSNKLEPWDPKHDEAMNEIVGQTKRNGQIVPLTVRDYIEQIDDDKFRSMQFGIKPSQFLKKVLSPDEFAHVDKISRVRRGMIMRMRSDFAEGKFTEHTKKYRQLMATAGPVWDGKHIRHYDKAFFISPTILYGPQESTDRIDTETTSDPLLPNRKVQRVYRSIEGVEYQLIPGPILSLDVKERRRQIKEIIKKNITLEGQWYREWNRWMNSFVERGVPRDDIKRHFIIQGVTSAQKAPQENQRAYTEIVNELDAGGDDLVRRLQEAATPRLAELDPQDPGFIRQKKNIWRDIAIQMHEEGLISDDLFRRTNKYDLGKSLEAWARMDDYNSLEERILAYGPKIGPYIHTALYPLNGEAVVIDRHMPRLWGYDQSWTVHRSAGSKAVTVDVMRLLDREIKQGARDAGVSPGEATAALWFEIREKGNDVAQSIADSYEEASRIDTERYLPKTLRELSSEEKMKAVSYRGHIYDVLRGTGFEEVPAPYSRREIAGRKAASTELNPFLKAVYAYFPNVIPEPALKAKVHGHLIDVENNMYDAIKDPLGFWKTAEERIRNDPQLYNQETGEPINADLHQPAMINTVGNLVRDNTEYKGLSLMLGSKPIYLMFDEIKATEKPVQAAVAMSEVAGSVDELPTKLPELNKVAQKRTPELMRDIKEQLLRYPVRILEANPTLASFRLETGGVAEHGVALQVEGPISAVRAAFSDAAGLRKSQNMVYLNHGQGETVRKVQVDFALRNDVTLEQVQQAIEGGNIREFNLMTTPTGYKVRMWADGWDLDLGKDLKLLYTSLGKEGTIEHRGANIESLDRSNYHKHLAIFHGHIIGEETYAEALKEGSLHRSRLPALIADASRERVRDAGLQIQREDRRRARGGERRGPRTLPGERGRVSIGDLCEHKGSAHEVIGQTEKGILIAPMTGGESFEAAYEDVTIPETQLSIISEGEGYKKAARQILHNVDNPKVVARGQDIARDALKIFRTIGLPDEAVKKITLRLTPYLSIPANQQAEASLRNWEESGVEPTVALGATTFYGDMTALVELATAVQNREKSLETLVHEAEHIAERWLLPESDIQILREAYGNREKRAEALVQFARDRNLLQNLDPKVRTIWQRLLDYLEKIARRFREMRGYRTSDDIYTDLMAGRYELRKKNGELTVQELSAETKAPPFYSELVEKMRTAPDIPRKPDSLRNWLQRFGKPEEIKWMDLDNWIAENTDKTGRVDKDAFREYVLANQLEMREIERGARNVPEDLSLWSDEQLTEAYETLGGRILQYDREMLIQDMRDILREHPDAWDKMARAASEVIGQPEAIYGAYQLPGGKNYREMLFQLPSGLRPQFISAHWTEPNILAHVRFNERDTQDGGRTLFLEEIQSDWLQKARDAGFQQGEERPQVNYATWGRQHGMTEDEIDATWQTQDPRYLQWQQEQDEILRYNMAQLQAVPYAPMLDTWHQTVLKRMIRYAAENGFDKIAWTTGAQQINRYEETLRQNVKRIEWAKGMGNTIEIVAYSDKEGSRRVYSEMVPFNAEDTTLESLLGKNMAAQVRSSVENEGSFEGDDLSIGGHGMKIFYDEVLPNFLKKYCRKWKALVHQDMIPVGTRRKYSGPIHTAETIQDFMPKSEGMWNYEVAKRMKAMIDHIRAVKSSDANIGDEQIFMEAADMHMRGAQAREIAETLGGSLREVPIYTAVHSMNITPQMRDEVIQKGQTLFRLDNPEQVAMENNAVYDGEWNITQEAMYQFTDNETGGSLTVKKIEDLPEALRKMRKAFREEGTIEPITGQTLLRVEKAHKRRIEGKESWEKVHGMMGEEDKPFDRASFLTRASTKTIDRYAALKKATPTAYKQARLFSSYKDVAKMKFDELIEVLKPVRNEEALFTDYVAAHRALTRAERGLKNPNNVTLDDAKEAIQQIEQDWINHGRQLQSLKDAFSGFQAWANEHILKESYKAGIISKAAYDRIKEQNQFYATFEVLDHLPQEVFELPMLPSKEYFSVANQKVIQTMVGTTRKIANPIESTIRKFMDAQALFAKNKVARAIIEDLDNKGILRPVVDSALEFITLKQKGYAPIKEGRWSPEQVQKLKNAGITDTQGTQGWLKKDYDTINYFADGKVLKFLVPIEIAEAAKAMTDRQGLRWIIAHNNVFRKSATSLYLPFTIGNSTRDAIMAYCTAPVYKWYNSPLFLKDWGKGLISGIAHEFGLGSGLAERYLKSGGGFGYVGELRDRKLAMDYLFDQGMIKNVKDIINPFGKKSVGTLIEKISSAVELAPRLGTFDRAVMKGLDASDAALMARACTIDFNRAGTWSRGMNQFIPFLNARIQARVTMIDAIKNNFGNTIPKMVLSAMLPGFATLMWNLLYYPDEYDDIPEYVKDQYFISIIGKDLDRDGKLAPKYLVVAKGDVGQVVWNPVEFWLSNSHKKDPSTIAALAVNWLNDVSPIDFARNGKPSMQRIIGSFTPPVIKGAVEHAMNANLYTGRELEPWWMEKKYPPELRAFESTPEMYKKLSETLAKIGPRISPVVLQNYASNTFAGYGRAGVSPGAMLRGLTGRIWKIQGGEKERQASFMLKDIEDAYISIRAYARKAAEDGDKRAARALMIQWNRKLGEHIKTYRDEFNEFPDLRDFGDIRKSYQFTPKKIQNVLNTRPKPPEKGVKRLL